MMTKKQASGLTKNSFETELRATLEHIHDVVWLGDNSLFATAYFLPKWTMEREGGDVSVLRGRGVQKLVAAAARELWDGSIPFPVGRSELADVGMAAYDERGNKSSHYRYLLLELRYLRRFFPPNVYPIELKDVRDFLGIGNTQFYAHIGNAVEDLGIALLKISQPTWRLEQPSNKGELVGRVRDEAVALERLRDGSMVAVSGRAGVGKTALGVSLFERWDAPCFWYTFRLGVNDNFESVIYSLGFFLSQNLGGGSTLWRQLLANKGIGGDVTPESGELWMGLLRDDLSQFEDPPLLCFDEVDLLISQSHDPLWEAHRPVLFFLEALRGVIPMLVMGQRVPFDTDEHIQLGAFSLGDSAELIKPQHPDLDDGQIAQIHKLCEGTPRLIELVLAVSDPSDIASLSMMAELGSVQSLFERLWRRLSEDEQAMMARMCVHEIPLPQSILGEESELVVSSLVGRRVMEIDADQAVVLKELIRQLMLDRLVREDQDIAHLEAAQHRLILGERTAAAHHLSAAGENGLAVSVWFPKLEDELQRGYGSWAQSIFFELSARGLSKQEQKKLTKIRNRLNLYKGEFGKVIERPTEGILGDDALSVLIKEQIAVAYTWVGDFENAERFFDEGITVLNRSLIQSSQLRHQKADLFLRAGRVAEVASVIEEGRMYLDYAQARLFSDKGDFDQAKEWFERVLVSAETSQQKTFIAATHRQLSILAGYRGDMTAAQHHAKKAMARYDVLGDEVSKQRVLAELGGGYLQVDSYTEAITVLTPALTFFETINESQAICGVSTMLADAYYNEGDLTTARKHASRVMQLEEPYYMPYALYTIGLTESDPSFFQNGIKIAESNQDNYIKAYLLKALGSLTKDRTHLQNALTLFQNMGLEKEAKKTEETLKSNSQ